MLKIKFLYLFVLLFLIQGCVTTGNLQSDIKKLNKKTNVQIIDSDIRITFKNSQGILNKSLSTAIPAGGLFIPVSNSKSLDVDKIAKEMAEQAFYLKFSNVCMNISCINKYEEQYFVDITTNADTSTLNGSHTANVKAVLYNSNNEQLLESEAEEVIFDWRYAQEGSMKRAFYRAYHKIIMEIDEYFKE